MIITYLRSSSDGAWDFCQARYYYEYVLGIKAKSNFKANLGNCLHKALEIFGQKKLAIQNNKKSFIEEESNINFLVDEVNEEIALNTAWNIYSKITPEEPWNEENYEKVKSWLHKGLRFNNGQFNPLNHNIIAPEKYFDIELPYPWAVCKDKNNKEQRLSIKGTVDLVVEDSPGVLHYIDWKSGAIKNWALNKDKDYNSLCKDRQLLLYFLALNFIYPEYKTIFVTIYYVQFDKPFTIAFSKKDLGYAEEMLRERFDEIKSCKIPKRIINNNYHKWKCSKLCEYGQKKMIINGKETNKLICNHLYDEILQIGLSRTTEKYGTKNAHSEYGSGGGRQEQKKD